MNSGADAVAALGVAGFTSVFSLVICVISVVSAVIGIALFVLWVWMLIDAIQRNDNEFGDTFGENSKLVWIILMLLFNGVISLVYYFLVYKKHPRKN